MPGISTRTGNNVDGTGGRKLGGKIENRLVELKFLNRALRNVLGRGAYCFVADIDSVNFNSCASSKPASEGDGGVSNLGGIKIRAVLDLHARFELGQVEKVTPVDRQVFNLLLVQNASN